MFKKSKRLIGLCLGLVLSLGVGVGLGNTHGEAVGVRAADAVTFTTTSSGGFSNNTKTIDGITCTFGSGASWQSNHVRVYVDGTLELSSTYTITQVDFSYSRTQTWTIKTGNGSFNDKYTTWTGSTNDLLLTNSDSAQFRISSIQVTYTVPIVEATGLTITPSAKSVHAGEELTLTTTLTGGSGEYEKTISWTSSDASVIASPENSEEGTEVTITALSVGTTTITGAVVSPGSATASVEIEVKAARTKTVLSLHGNINKDNYGVGEDWDLTGLDLEVTWSEGDPSYVDFSADDVVYECDPKKATDTSITSFSIRVLYDNFDETFTVSGITVIEKPYIDTLSVASTSLNLSNSGYTEFSKSKSKDTTDITSNATWAGKAMMATGANDGAIQINATTGAIYTAASTGQVVSSVAVDFKNDNSKTLKFYGSNTAFTSILSATNLSKYNLLATLDEDTPSAEIEGSYRYLYIFSNGGATYSNSITVTWKYDAYESDALAFGTSFLNTTSTSCTNPSLDNSESLKSVWSSLKTTYGNLSDAAKQFVKDTVANASGTDLENAMARYDHIIGRYSSTHTDINDFIGRSNSTPNASNMIYKSTDNNTAILIVVLVSFTSITAIGGYFFIRKRRYN